MLLGSQFKLLDNWKLGKKAPMLIYRIKAIIGIALFRGSFPAFLLQIVTLLEL